MDFSRATLFGMTGNNPTCNSPLCQQDSAANAQTPANVPNPADALKFVERRPGHSKGNTTSRNRREIVVGRGAIEIPLRDYAGIVADYNVLGDFQPFHHGSRSG
jgi:hypothetical protein